MDGKPDGRASDALEVFAVFLRLGLTAFGGPIAHIAYFRREFVERRAWIAEDAFADLLALAQFLPGPASSQLGMAIGLKARRRLGRHRRLPGLHPAGRRGDDRARLSRA
jgi:chromate transporter